MDVSEVIRRALTDEQQVAAMDPAAEVLAIACAGSGKSRTLAYRIARLLSEGAPPESIVAFTFTEKAADAIKRRVAQALAAAGLDPAMLGAMYIGTIHSYCQHILGEMDAIYRQYDVLDDNRLTLFLISRFYDMGLNNLYPRVSAKSKYFRTINSVASAWKTSHDEMLNLDDICEKDPGLGEVLTTLSSKLNEEQFIDFSMMIRLVVDALLEGDQRVENSVSKLKHLMVDEYQDVNPCQEALITALHNRSETLFVVGDDDQSIYAWRGADVSNIIEFNIRYPNCSTHELSINFRSTEPIVDVSSRFVADTLGASRLPKSPEAAEDKTPQDFRRLWFDARQDEVAWIAERIKLLIGTKYVDGDGAVRGLTPGDFAILMRSTRQQETNSEFPRHAPYTQALSEAGIPFSLEAGGGPFERPQVSALRSSFELLRSGNPGRNEVREVFDREICPAYPAADFTLLTHVLSDWGRNIHRPKGSTRQRLYPQQLVYDLLGAFKLSATDFGADTNAIMRDIGLFSTMVLDVETVYMSVDSKGRFSELLNFLQNTAESGYDVSTDDFLLRPDSVTVSTVHKMKGLEYPCVFVVDVEAQRFPKKRSKYSGWLPDDLMLNAINRGAYQSTPQEEARLFYTAITRAERYLYITGAENTPGAKKEKKRSPFALALTHDRILDDPNELPDSLNTYPQKRRISDDDMPTSFSEIRYYLRCPKEYQIRQSYGFNPAVPALFGYGRVVHTAIEKLHQKFPNAVPTAAEAEAVVEDSFHLKHVPPSRDPVESPGAYENAKSKAKEIASTYVERYGDDFTRQREVEARFEIPSANCVISGAIDLLLRESEEGEILGAEIIDYKTMEGGENPQENKKLDWTEMSLQVQLYSRAAKEILGENAKTGSVHLLKDNRRIEVPVTENAIASAIANVEWAVKGIIAQDFPMRPHPEKCGSCDFNAICKMLPEGFSFSSDTPPAIQLPDGKTKTISAFSLSQLNK